MIQTVSLMVKPRPPAVILDLDGTVADTLDDLTGAVNFALEHENRETLDRDAVRQMVGDGLPTLMARAGRSSDEAAIAVLVRRFKQHYHENYLANTHLYAGAEQFFARCKDQGVLLAILSNKPHEFTRLICDQLLSSCPIGAIMGAHDGLPIKPDPAAALAAADTLKRNPAEVFLVGDSVVDVETARAASMRSVAVTWGFQDAARLQTAKPDFLAHSFDELWAVVTAETPPRRDPHTTSKPDISPQSMQSSLRPQPKRIGD